MSESTSFDLLMDHVSQMPDAKIFLTGRAKSIQQVRAYLKDSGVPTNKLKVRAYLSGWESWSGLIWDLFSG